MGEWKKSSDDELINNLRRGLLMDAKKRVAEAKKLADAANAKRVEVEESLQVALDSLTKAEDKIRAYELESEQAKRDAYETGSKEAQDEMGLQLPGVSCLAPPPKPSTDVVDLEDAEVTSVPTAEEPVDADLPPDVSTPADEGGSTAPLDADLDDL
uniref:Uncharacterized protein n=1 Tax=Fagus sylvatica TaxID=28930 RepID=A0A2N9GJM3_FAGSY